MAGVLLLLTCAGAAQGQPVLSVTTVTRARLTMPTEFWRAGALTASGDLLVIRTNVRNRAEFVLRNSSGPLFIFGSTVCILVQNPFEDGEAIALAPRAIGTETLWLVGAGHLPQKLVPPLIDRLRQEATGLQRSVQVPPASGPLATFPNLESLVRSLTGATP
jgi:hypothetical protein